MGPVFFPQFPQWINQLIEAWLHGGVPFQAALAIGFAMGMAFQAVMQLAMNAANNGNK